MQEWIDRVVSRVVGRLAPSIEAERRFARFARARVSPWPPLYPDSAPRVPLAVLGSRGLDLDAEPQLATIAAWKAARYQELFGILRQDPSINPYHRGQQTVYNGFFETPDAEIYASLIVGRQPGRIVEIGAGYTTLIARTAVRYARSATKILVIDPAPRTDVHEAADQVVLQRVEKSGLAESAWAPGDLLFIDSSHVCRTRGDVVFLLCQVLPALPAGVLVHVHDVFLPYDYPNFFDRRLYTEQYLLYGTLSYSRRYRTVLATHWLSRHHVDEMRDVFGEAVGRDPISWRDPWFYGSSYWFEVQ